MKDSDTKGHVLYDSVCTECPGQANAQRQEADCGAGVGRGVAMASGAGAFFGERKMFETGGCGEMPNTLTVLRATEVFTLKW